MDDLRFAFVCWMTILAFVVALFLGGVALVVAAVTCAVHVCEQNLNLFAMGACGVGIIVAVVGCSALWYWNVLVRGSPSR